MCIRDRYTHARAASVLRNAGESAKAVVSENASLDMNYVTSDTAYELIKLIYRFPDVVKEAAEKYEPSVITRHIIDIAQYFNRFYHDEHILVENEAEKQAKLAVVYAAKQTIANGLALLGIAAPEKM